MHVDVRREAEVARILTRDGRTQGVALVDGKTIEAPVVASSVDAHWTFERMLDPESLPVEFREAVARNALLAPSYALRASPAAIMAQSWGDVRNKR